MAFADYVARRVVIRPILGRLHCGDSADAYYATAFHVIRPILGRLHCGTTQDTRQTQKGHKSSGRSSAGSIAAPTAGSSPSRSGGVIRPILGRLHCGPDIGRNEVAGTGGHPADPRPAPLRPVDGQQADAFPGRHPADPRPAPLRPALLLRGGRGGLVIRPILGRLHCGASIQRTPIARFTVIRPILGRLHCGSRCRDKPGRAGAGHPADPRPAPLRRDRRGHGVGVAAESSGRSSAGSIAAAGSPSGTGTPRCRHPADPRPAPLRRRRCRAPARPPPTSSGRSSAGSIAAPRP